MRVARSWLAATVFLACLSAPFSARAYEDQLGLSAGAGYAAVASDAALPHHGFVLQLEASIGLGDVWELRFALPYALEVDQTMLHRLAPGAEIVYLVDILALVPFLGLGVDAPISIHARADATAVWVDFAVHGVVGLDWLVQRELALGIEVRPYVMLTALASDPVWLTAIARVQWLFEIGPL